MKDLEERRRALQEPPADDPPARSLRGEMAEAKVESTVESTVEATEVAVPGGKQKPPPQKQKQKQKQDVDRYNTPRKIRQLRRELHQRHVSTGELFAKMDTDRNNRVSFREFARGLTMAGVARTATDVELKELFASLDADGDRAVTWSEMVAALEGEFGPATKGKKNQKAGEAPAVKVTVKTGVQTKKTKAAGAKKGEVLEKDDAAAADDADDTSDIQSTGPSNPGTDEEQDVPAQDKAAQDNATAP